MPPEFSLWSLLFFSFFLFFFFLTSASFSGGCRRSLKHCTVSASRGMREGGDKEEGREEGGLENRVRGMELGQNHGLWLKNIFQMLSAVETIWKARKERRKETQIHSVSDLKGPSKAWAPTSSNYLNPKPYNIPVRLSNLKAFFAGNCLPPKAGHLTAGQLRLWWGGGGLFSVELGFFKTSVVWL